mmetsp:Transcript_17831/g.51102  ORF Transcript_17831/g.51102 Transcript_17831/m.51102 type:complete len:937 (+) Transcript_17831:323-3133(+)
MESRAPEFHEIEFTETSHESKQSQPNSDNNTDSNDNTEHTPVHVDNQSSNSPEHSSTASSKKSATQGAERPSTGVLRARSSKVLPNPPHPAAKEAWAQERSFSFPMGQKAKIAPAADQEQPATNSRSNFNDKANLALSSNDDEKQPRIPSRHSLANKRYPFISHLYSLMEGRSWTAFIMSVTIYALFGDDFRVALFSKDFDTVFFTLSLLAMLTFAVELFIFTFAKPGYYKSFYFWLDVIATVTMFSDVGFIWEPMLELFLTDESAGSTSQDALSAIRASRVGTKSSRIVRIVRIVRLVRVVKLYKASKGEDALDDQMAEENPSLVGKKLSDKTMQRVITVVLSMLIFVQFFDYSMYTNMPTRGVYGLYRLHKRFQQRNQSSPDFADFLQNDFRDEVEDYTRGLEDRRLIFISIHGAGDYARDILEFARSTSWQDPESGLEQTMNDALDYSPTTDIELSEEGINEAYRASEYEVASASLCFDEGGGSAKVPHDTSCGSFAYFDIRTAVRWAAALNIFQTIFVMIVLTGGSLMFSNDAEKLVIRPIERMVISVKQLAENPMGSTGLGEIATYGGDPNEDDETVLLQRTIAKIGQLLQIGFGEAGSEIIAMNMSNNSGIEPMCDGVKIEAVFGFCDIRNFTDTTECLQEKVMVYVNKVGAIVHEATHTWYGAANKNIGDAFLLVWKVNGHKRGLPNGASAGNMCDNALIAFLKSIIDLKRENGPGGCLNEYKDNPAIRRRFGEGNFEIRLGMGLHIGWAIEGTIGSKYKIDASYLSPNVNMASRLEAATKQFRTPLLLSEDFYDALSSKARKRCRQIDKVTVKGSVQPMGLFTCDIITFPRSFGEAQFFDDGVRKAFDFDGEDMDAIQAGMPPNFFAKFRVAMTAYFNGEWAVCKVELEKILEEKPEDGPAISLLEVMKKHDFLAPSGWRGYRELTEK